MTAETEEKIREGLEDLLVVDQEDSPQERPLATLTSRYWSGTDFAGRTFDSLPPNPVHEISAADIVAVTLLDVSYPPRAVRALLIDRAVEFGGMLARIPADIDIWDEGADEALEAAEMLWRELCAFDNVDWVKAGKLLARKRPRLIPVYDSVVKHWFQEPSSFWRPLGHVLREDRDGLRSRLHNALAPAEHQGITLLRMIDVAIWMLGSRSNNAARARSGLNLDLDGVSDRLRYEVAG